MSVQLTWSVNGPAPRAGLLSSAGPSTSLTSVSEPTVYWLVTDTATPTWPLAMVTGSAGVMVTSAASASSVSVVVHVAPTGRPLNTDGLAVGDGRRHRARGVAVGQHLRALEGARHRDLERTVGDRVAVLVDGVGLDGLGDRHAAGLEDVGRRDLDGRAVADGDLLRVDGVGGGPAGVGLLDVAHGAGGRSSIVSGSGASPSWPSRTTSAS